MSNTFITKIGGNKMERSKYIETIREKYSKYFDIENNIDILGEKIDMYARFSMKSNRTFLTKNDVVDSFETNEYCFVKTFKSLNLRNVTLFSEFLKGASKEFVAPHKNHMCSYVTGIMISDEPIPLEAKEYVKGFKFYKIYKLYLKGWSEVRLILVDLESNSVITNRPGKKVKKVYLPTP